MRATIGITTGDPAGIGLEIILASVGRLLPIARTILFTDRSVFDRNAALFGADFSVQWIDSVSESTDESVLFLKDTGGGTVDVPWGERSVESGERAMAYLKCASEAALRGDIDAIVTAPVSKEAIGGDFRGQTDFLAAQAGRGRFAMAFFTSTFKVILATIHLSLRDALSRISAERYEDLIRLTDSELRRLGFGSSRIAVAGINPHAGEGGMFGREEIEILGPAVTLCAADGIDVSGPFPADSLYTRAHLGEFDVVIAPYHDQGLIPVKLVARRQATNVTLGLPYIRTSPDHGTAFGIAGKGVANAEGMEAALSCALDLVERSKRGG
jgi:4-hydroxythreonine-4-phosphate dehydrogenase